MTLFEVVLRDALHHGVLVGVALPDAPDPVPDAVMGRLHVLEQEYARSLRGYRQVDWVGGRLAAREAFATLGRRTGPVLTDPYGAPEVQGPFVVSISHKRHTAVALAAREEHGPIGVDLEDLLPERAGIASRVLTPVEMDEIEALPPDRRWTSVVLRFALKEAVYKAVAPRLRRYVKFEEAEVHPGTDNRADVVLHLAGVERPPQVDARYRWLGRGVLATVRARWP